MIHVKARRAGGALDAPRTTLYRQFLRAKNQFWESSLSEEVTD
jgi:hypothetical protein